MITADDPQAPRPGLRRRGAGARPADAGHRRRPRPAPRPGGHPHGLRRRRRADLHRLRLRDASPSRRPRRPAAGRRPGSTAPPRGSRRRRRTMVLARLSRSAAASLVLLVIAFGGLGTEARGAVETRIAAYTRKGAQAARGAAAPEPQGVAAAGRRDRHEGPGEQQGLRGQARARLEAAGMAMKPAEWLLIHAGIAVRCPRRVCLLAPAASCLRPARPAVRRRAGPWFYLGFKQAGGSRRSTPSSPTPCS